MKTVRFVPGTGVLRITGAVDIVNEPTYREVLTHACDEIEKARPSVRVGTIEVVMHRTTGLRLSRGRQMRRDRPRGPGAAPAPAHPGHSTPRATLTLTTPGTAWNVSAPPRSQQPADDDQLAKGDTRHDPPRPAALASTSGRRRANPREQIQLWIGRQLVRAVRSSRNCLIVSSHAAVDGGAADGGSSVWPVQLLIVGSRRSPGCPLCAREVLEQLPRRIRQARWLLPAKLRRKSASPVEPDVRSSRPAAGQAFSERSVVRMIAPAA